MKLLYFDTETTGLHPAQNDILTIGGVIEIDGHVKEEFYLEMQPFNYDTISPEALKVNKLTVDQIRKFMSPNMAYRTLVSKFDRFIDKYNRADKFVCVGQNVGFDIGFLTQFFLKNGNKYCGSYIDYHYLDTMVLLNTLRYKNILKLENCKLETACKYFDIPIEAHNALSDIKATRSLFKKLIQYIGVPSEIR
jgi:DNA polymerase III epsilon subunit-like protein